MAKNGDLKSILESARRELLDLSGRNRLLNTPRGVGQTSRLDIVDELSSEVFRQLVVDQKAMSFLPASDSSPVPTIDSEEALLSQPEDDVAPGELTPRHYDSQLQTTLTSEGLQKRLLKLFYDARTFEEEQGINILYLAIGFLKWHEDDKSTRERFAPLLLIPIKLDRTSATSRFKVRYTEDDISTNLSLQARLKNDFNIELPSVEDVDELSPSAYFDLVQAAIAEQTRWEIMSDDMVIWFYSFSKLLMYRDLQDENWPEDRKLEKHDLLCSMLRDGFGGDPPICGEDDNVDQIVSPREMIHVLDADSSQTVVIDEVKRGRNLVIQGPPGTGKSQTIANLIAVSVMAGKSVLFVCEKMAALEVVRRRFCNIGLGDMILELHSNKANKRALLDDLNRTLLITRPVVKDIDGQCSQVQECRDRLNRYLDILHSPHGEGGFTPYQIVGELVRLRATGTRFSAFRLPDSLGWSRDDFQSRANLLRDVVSLVAQIGKPDDNAWRGVELDVSIPSDVERLKSRIETVLPGLDELVQIHRGVRSSIGISIRETAQDLRKTEVLCRQFSCAPPMDRSCFANAVWHQDPTAIRRLVDLGKEHWRRRAELRNIFHDEAWTTPAQDVLADLKALRHAWMRHVGNDIDIGMSQKLELIQSRLRVARSCLEQLGVNIRRAAKPLNMSPPRTVFQVSQLARIASLIVNAPAMDRRSVGNEAWVKDRDQIDRLVQSGQEYQKLRDHVCANVNENAWSIDAASLLATLARHHKSLFRFLRRDFKTAKATLDSVLAASAPKSISERIAILELLLECHKAAESLSSRESCRVGSEAFGTLWRAVDSDWGSLSDVCRWEQAARQVKAHQRFFQIAARAESTEGLSASIEAIVQNLKMLRTELDKLAEELQLDVLTLLGGRSWSEIELQELLITLSSYQSDPESLFALHIKQLSIRASDPELFATYARSHAGLREILVSALPSAIVHRVSLLEALVSGQAAAASLLSPLAIELGQNAFGNYWNGVESDWEQLARVCEWEAELRQHSASEELHKLFARLNNMEDAVRFGERLAKTRGPTVTELVSLFKDIQLNPEVAFGEKIVDLIPLSDVAARLRQWHANAESLSLWTAYWLRRKALESFKLTDLAQKIHSGQITPSEAANQFEMAYFEDLIRDVFRAHSDLAAFNSGTHVQLLQRFKQLDVARIDLAKQEVAKAHFDRLPKGESSVGEFGTLRREIQKKRRHLPIRKLLTQAGHAIQAIKPVFMMSPISVAQYLQPGVLEFDVLVIDEASQVQPVDALGAISRVKQIVVVGDSKQLPPTRFFSRVLNEDADESPDPEVVTTGDMDSILGLCCAQGVPQRMLRWHYRSRHHSLIAVSNHEFYDDRLYVVPSPGPPRVGQGLVFRYVEEGRFDRGRSATNRVEAKKVAEAVMSHARHSPGKTLGVGAFSVSQRDAILEELELLRRADPSVEAFFMLGKREPFFVKNLENIQGDERDVVFISVGYGKDESGYMAMGFGPLSNDGGERRLNVLITRSRDCCTVFSSIKADDIDLSRGRARGTQALKTFLKYAETGLMDTGVQTDRDYESEFERQVAIALHSKGLETHAQVGVAGFFIDLAVVDPLSPGRYLLGIECDGANYHRSRSARDRDRLRQQVLEDRGWIIHRIWSTDWFHRPEDQLHSCLAAIENARATWASRSEARSCVSCKNNAPSAPSTIHRDESAPDNSVQGADSACTPYIEFSRLFDSTLEIPDISMATLANVVCRVVEVEGPVHQDEIARRVADCWGYKRTGSRAYEAIEVALTHATQDGRLEQFGLYFQVAGQSNVPIRNRENVRSQTLRKPEYLPPVEIQAAILTVVDAHLGILHEETVIEVARLFGFRSTSLQLRAVIQDEIKFLCDQGQLRQRDDKLFPAEAAEQVET